MAALTMLTKNAIFGNGFSKRTKIWGHKGYKGQIFSKFQNFILFCDNSKGSDTTRYISIHTF